MKSKKILKFKYVPLYFSFKLYDIMVKKKTATNGYSNVMNHVGIFAEPGKLSGLKIRNGAMRTMEHSQFLDC